MIHVTQLRAAGLGRGAIAHRVATGRLVPMHRGVYLVGVVIPPLGKETAAVLAGGPGAVLSHLAAAAVWGVHGELGQEMHITVPGGRGPRVAGVVGHGARPALTRSEAEAALLDLLRAGGIPPSGVNARIGPYEVDFVWRDQRLIVEVDGYAFHGSRAAFERDRLRDAELAAAGWRVIRVTWRQIVDTPVAVVARIAGALARQARG